MTESSDSLQKGTQSRTNHPLLLALVAGSTGAVLALIGQYLITYRSIEMPKIELERRKVDIETYKLGVTLIPVVEPTCMSRRLEKSVWRVTCRFSNKGQYPVVGRLLGVALHSGDDVVGIPIMEGPSVYVQFTNWKEMFTKDGNTFDIPTGPMVKEFAFIVKPREEKLNGMVSRPDVVVKTYFDFQTMQSAAQYLRLKFPDGDGMLTSFAKSLRPIVVTAQESQ